MSMPSPEVINELLMRLVKDCEIPPPLIPEVARACLAGAKIVVVKTADEMTIYADGSNIIN